MMMGFYNHYPSDDEDNNSSDYIEPFEFSKQIYAAESLYRRKCHPNFSLTLCDLEIFYEEKKHYFKDNDSLFDSDDEQFSLQENFKVCYPHFF